MKFTTKYHDYDIVLDTKTQRYSVTIDKTTNIFALLIDAKKHVRQVLGLERSERPKMVKEKVLHSIHAFDGDFETALATHMDTNGDVWGLKTSGYSKGKRARLTSTNGPGWNRDYAYADTKANRAILRRMKENRKKVEAFESKMDRANSKLLRQLKEFVPKSV